MTVREGQVVKEGEQLGHVDDKAVQIAGQKAAIELRIARAQSESEVNLKFARKAHGVAKAELNRSLESIKAYPKSVSATELDQQKLSADKAELEIEQAQRDLEIAKMTAELKQTEVATSQHEVNQRKVISPISGVVVQLHKKQGEWVNPGDPVVRILTLDRLRVECSLSAQLYGPELNGCPVKLNMEMKNRKEVFEGKIVFVNPEVEPVNGKFRVWAEVENRDGLLRPGQPGCTLTIMLPAADKGSEKAKTAKSE
jgi:RND family efflux transporter MFP subunit